MLLCCCIKNYRLNTKQLQELRNAPRRAKRNNETINTADRIKAVYLLGSGWKVNRVVEVLMIDESTVRRYFANYQESGVDGLVETNYKGSEGFLSDAEESELDEYLESHPCMNSLEVIVYVEQEYEISYSASGMNSLLKRLS